MIACLCATWNGLEDIDDDGESATVGGEPSMRRQEGIGFSVQVWSWLLIGVCLLHLY